MFIIFILMQIIICMGMIFFFTTIYSTRENYIKQYESVRTIRISQFSPGANQSVSQFMDELKKDQKIKIENAKFEFILKSEISMETPRKWISYLYPEQFSNRVVGKGITQTEIENLSPVLLASNVPTLASSEGPVMNIGDTLSLDGLNLRVSGYYRLIGYRGEIPYTVGLKHFYLNEMNLTLPVEASDNQKEYLANQLKAALPESKVIMPTQITQKTISSMVIPLAAAFLVGVNSIISLLFIFKYMLESSRTDFFVMKICGSSNKKLFLTIVNELAAVYTGCFLVSLTLFTLFRSIFRENPIFLNSRTDLPIVLIVYVISFAVILLIMIPYLIRYRKQTLNSGGTI